MNKDFLNINTKTFQEYEVENFQDLWNKVKSEYKGLSTEVDMTFEKTIIKSEGDKEDEVYIFTASDDKEDRHGDIVFQDWDLKYFKKNPVLLDSHNYSSITHIIGTFNKLVVENGQLKGEVKFSKANPKGQLAKEMVDEGTLRAGSVGFIPKEFDQKGNIIKSELLEYSLVSVPANPRATREKQIEEIKEEVQEAKTIISTLKIDKNKYILNNIKASLEKLNKDNVEKEKRNLFKAIRSLK